MGLRGIEKIVRKRSICEKINCVQSVVPLIWLLSQWLYKVGYQSVGLADLLHSPDSHSQDCDKNSDFVVDMNKGPKLAKQKYCCHKLDLWFKTCFLRPCRVSLNIWIPLFTFSLPFNLVSYGNKLLK